MAANAEAAKFTRLENPDSGRFWEITVTGKESRIRSGKTGCKGRLFAPKVHKSTLKALQFARWHVDGKSYEGFNKISEYVKDIPKVRGTPNPERPPLKKRVTLRRALSKQASKKVIEETPVPRKPPKKQNTIRNLAKAGKLSTVTPKQTPTKITTAKHVPRKPPKKQNTIRNLARTSTVTFQTPDDKQNDTGHWRKPPKKQSTIRRNYTKRKTQSKVLKATRIVQTAIKKSRLESKISSIKRKRVQEESGSRAADIPFKRYKTGNKSEAKPPMKQVTSGVKKRKDPRITHGKAYHSKKSTEAERVKPISTPEERRGKIAVGISSKPAPKRVRTKGKASNQVTLPSVEDVAPPKLTRKLSRKNSKQSLSSSKEQQFVEPKIPPLKKGGSLRRQVLKKGLARQDTLEIDSSKPGVPSNIQDAIAMVRNKTLSRMPSLTVGPDQIYMPARKEWPLQMLAPVIWRHVATEEGKQNTHVHAVYADTDRVLFGDERGYVVEVNSEGHIVNIFYLYAGKTKKTPAIKSIIKQQNHLYVGCSDGCVYDISQGIPRKMYSAVDGQPYVEIESMVLLHGLLVTADIRGRVTAVNHDGIVMWQIQGQGPGGRMLCIDDLAVYHGHYLGVTKYSITNGNIMWSVGSDWKAAVLAGSQFGDSLYAAANTKVGKLRKRDGKLIDTYNTGGIITSVAVAAGLVFAADHHIRITIFDEASSVVVYKLTHNISVLSMQYHSGRLYTVGPGGLSVVELSKKSVMAAKKGQELPAPAELSSLEKMPTLQQAQPPLQQVECTVKKRAPKGHIILRCIKDAKTNKLRVTPQSAGFKRQMSCQFPLNLKKAGATFLVEDLEESQDGKFYRVAGNILEIEGYGT